MAAVPSLSEPQRSGDSHPAVSHLVQKLVEEVLAWQRRNGVQKIPSKYSGDCEERKLALRFEKLLLRRDKALGTEPSRSQLSPSEVALVNSVPGVPLRGCSATASCSSTVARQLPESAAIEGPRHAPANCVGGLNPKIYCLAVLVYTMQLTQRTLTSSIAKNFWRDSKNTWRL